MENFPPNFNNRFMFGWLISVLLIGMFSGLPLGQGSSVRGESQ